MRHLVTAALFAILFFQGCSKKDQSNETNTTQPVDPALQTLTLSIGADELPENNETTVTVIAADGKEITTAGGIVWHMSDANATEINGTKLIAKKEGTTTIRAEFNGKYSQEQNVTVYKIIHGHRLPPEPDPKINNSTLLGIDSNHNGVRDDVERWIYTRYDTYIPCRKEAFIIPGTDINATRDVCEDTPVPYHQIVREIAMQFGRAAQIVIQDPDRALETMQYMDNAVNCAAYFQYFARYRHEPILLEHYIFDTKFKTIEFNTVMRTRAFAEYNHALSGGVYGSPSIDGRREGCEFNATKLLKENP
jgi:hypothetical protein